MSDSVSSSHQSITTYGEALETLRKEGGEGWREWANARAASADRGEISRLEGLMHEREMKRRRGIGKIWGATLLVERAEKLKKEVD